MPYFNIDLFTAAQIIEEDKMNEIRADLRYLHGDDGPFQWVAPAGFARFTTAQRDALITGLGTTESPYIYPAIGVILWNSTIGALELHLGNGVWGPVSTGFPVGTVLDHLGDTPPLGFLECNGASVSRITYPALFDVLGTTYGTTGVLYGLGNNSDHLFQLLPNGVIDLGDTGLNIATTSGLGSASGILYVVNFGNLYQLDPLDVSNPVLLGSLGGSNIHIAGVGDTLYHIKTPSSLYRTNINDPENSVLLHTFGTLGSVGLAGAGGNLYMLRQVNNTIIISRTPTISPFDLETVFTLNAIDPSGFGGLDGKLYYGRYNNSTLNELESPFTNTAVTITFDNMFDSSGDRLTGIGGVESQDSNAFRLPTFTSSKLNTIVVIKT